MALIVVGSSNGGMQTACNCASLLTPKWYHAVHARCTDAVCTPPWCCKAACIHEQVALCVSACSCAHLHADLYGHMLCVPMQLGRHPSAATTHRSCSYLHADLALRNCPLPAVALPLLRNPMLELRTLEVDVSACEGIANSTLEPLLLALLCRPPTGAAPLEGLAITRCPNTINAVQCVRSVTEQLEADFGVSGVALSVQ